MQRYQFTAGKGVELGADKTSHVAFELKSKQVYYGRVLFDDGSPAVLSPASTRWEDIRIKLDARRSSVPSVSLGEVEKDGYFKIHLGDNALEMYKSRGKPMDICLEQDDNQVILPLKNSSMIQKSPETGLLSMLIIGPQAMVQFVLHCLNNAGFAKGGQSVTW